MVTVWWSAASLIYYSFLNPSKTITSEKYAQQIDEIHQKLQCLQLALLTEQAQFFSTTSPVHSLHNQHFKSWTNWVTNFCLICHIHLTSYQPTTTSSSISTTFCRENASTTRRHRKCFPRVCWIWKSRFLCYRNKLISYWQKRTVMVPIFISCWQKCIDCDGSCFINKDVF